MSDSKNVLYSYFKTDISFPFPAIVHGTFDLSSNRNQLIKNKENGYLIEQLIDLLIDTAVKISESKRGVNYEALKLLAFQDHFDPVMNNDYKFIEKLISKIKERAIFPTVAGTYISYEDKPVFYKNPYAEILSGDIFNNLLLFTEDKRVRMLLGQLELYEYKYEHFIKSINLVSVDLNVLQKVLCIKYILEDFWNELRDERNTIKPFLLIDSNGNNIEEEIEIFLPAENEIFKNMPEFIKLKFLGKEMFDTLRKELGDVNARGIAEKLKNLNVYEYSFEPVLRRIANYTRELCEEQQDRKFEYVTDFIKWLFEVYESNRMDLPKISTTLKIPILSRDETIEDADNLYFGIEFDNFLGENLLRDINNIKFVYDYNKIKLENDDLDLVVDFFKWLGVAHYPRTKVSRLDNESQDRYKEYVFNNLKEFKVQDYSFNSLKELKDKLAWVSSIDVLNIELLDEILKSAEFEDVLTWLIEDSTLKNIIDSKVELDRLAEVRIQLQPTNSYIRKMNNTQMASFLLWKLRTTPWIKTKSGTKAIPSKCCLAKNISSDFSPLIEIPDIDYSKEIFKKYNVSRDDVEYWLGKIGLPKDFGDFTTDTAYSILLRLPEVDKEGNNAKSLYRQIVQNSSEEKWDKNNSKYKEYMNEGQVLARLNGIKDYFPIEQVYYLDNRMFCDDIIRQFPILELEKRSGEKKVRSILGVKPLKDIRFKIVEEPVLHQLNNIFTADFNKFLPYIYCFRIDKDSKHVERNAIKEIKIYLCNEINAAYSIGEQDRTFEVKAYEYIYIEEERKVFLKIEPCEHQEIIHLKLDFNFCEAIAEILSGVIKVEENRKDFRELYSKTISQRDATLRSDLDDEKLLKLAEAKELLGVCIDSKIDFWSIVHEMISPGDSLPEKEDELRDYLHNKYGIGLNIINKMFNEFDYDNIDGTENNIKLLTELFNILSLDVHDFNTYAVREIHFDYYYNKKFENLKNHFRKKYYSLLYNKTSNLSVEDKKQFENNKNEYDNLSIEFVNSVNFNVEQEFFNKLQIPKIELESIEELDLSKIFFVNKEEFFLKLKKEIQIEVSTDEFINFCDKLANKSLIYFGELEQLIEMSKSEFIKPTDESESSGSISVENEDTIKSKLRKITNSNSIGIIDGRADKPILNKKVNAHERGSSHNKPGRLSEKEKEEIGSIGECHVYKELVNKYGSNKIVWASEYAKKAEINEDGKDGLGYDFKYTLDNGSQKYVEVKSTSGDQIVFYITKAEVAFAESHKDSYELLIVINAFDDSNRKIINLGNIFNYSGEETFTNNSRFFVENKDYRIKTEVKEISKL